MDCIIGALFLFAQDCDVCTRGRKWLHLTCESILFPSLEREQDTLHLVRGRRQAGNIQSERVSSCALRSISRDFWRSGISKRERETKKKLFVFPFIAKYAKSCRLHHFQRNSPENEAITVFSRSDSDSCKRMGIRHSDFHTFLYDWTVHEGEKIHRILNY